MSEDAAEAARPRPRKAASAFRTISEVADDLHIPQHVLRFWETKFPQLKPLKRGGGRRYYRPENATLVFVGDADAGAAAIAPFRAVATPYGEMVAPMPYPGIYEFTKEAGEPTSSTGRSRSYPATSPEAARVRWLTPRPPRW